LTVHIGPAYSVVVRKDALLAAGFRPESVIGLVGDLVSQDSELLVLGPLFETERAIHLLTEMGLEYFEGFFDIPNSGAEPVNRSETPSCRI